MVQKIYKGHRKKKDMSPFWSEISKPALALRQHLLMWCVVICQLLQSRIARTTQYIRACAEYSIPWDNRACGRKRKTKCWYRKWAWITICRLTKLCSAVKKMGPLWAKVSSSVGRMPSDCRDRYRNQLANREKRNAGNVCLFKLIVL